MTLLLLGAGCAQDSNVVTRQTPSRIDGAKVIDMDAPTPFAMRITIFYYQETDSNGWPADVQAQEYVRFLQDQGIDVGFVRDGENHAYVAMVNAADVAAVRSADKMAASAGITKPPMVPDSMRLDAHQTQTEADP
ncbi:MAG TPA: hypothetical protein VMP01_00195 [Pirellulaceae bacterium]|nr:hypothetical protein [Pirellulaceae bacterium]